MSELVGGVELKKAPYRAFNQLCSASLFDGERRQ